jgi:hypothetical protein
LKKQKFYLKIYKKCYQEKIDYLMNGFNIRKRENNLSLSQNKTYKSQHELLLNKYNSTKSDDKINEFENKINQIRLIILILLKNL